MSANGFSSSGFERIDEFALVSYLPDPLASFLDRLRLELVPDCKPHAHVTILPPRRLCGDASAAIQQVREGVLRFRPFEIQLGGVAKFDGSNVIYVELASGVEKLRDLYCGLNRDVCSFCERYPYSPHITLAQCLPPEQVQRVFETARERWSQCPFQRSFQVDTLTFVQNTTVCRWLDLATIPLGAASPPRITQRDLAEPVRSA